MNLVEDNKQRNLFGNIIKNAYDSIKKFLMLIFVFNGNDLFLTLTNAVFTVFYIDILVKGIDSGFFKEFVKSLFACEISVIKGIYPIHHRTVRRLDSTRLELMIKYLNYITGFEHRVVYSFKRYGKGVVMLKEADIVFLIIELLKHESDKIAYIHFSI